MSVRRQLRYRFDNLMARGTLAQILLLFVATVLIVLITSGAMFLLDAKPIVGEGDEAHPASFGLSTWKALMHTFDPGTLGGDDGTWTYLFILLFATLGGIFILSALIGVINNGFSQMLDRLRRGRSVVIEYGHTVILGWTPKIHTLLTELVEANRNQRGGCVVILADRDKVDMDVEIAGTIGKKASLRVVTRSGSPMMAADLGLVSLSTSRAVIVLAPEINADGSPMAANESDTVILKTLLALAKASPGHHLHVVAEIFDPHSEPVARMVAGERAALILAMPLISRLLVQTGRQSGLSAVYTELLDFAGNEIYVRREDGLVGVTFGDAIHRYGTSSLIGVVTADGRTLVPPEFDRAFVAGDSVIAISEDDDTLVLDGGKPVVDEHHLIARAPTHNPSPERTLVLGAGPRLGNVLSELDSYVAAGSEALVVGETEQPIPMLQHMKVAFRGGDLTDRRVLDSLDITSFDHVLALSETVGRTQEMADARTMVTLLHLRDIERRAGKKVSITSEILDINNRDLATISEADDFIVSNTLISLMVSQVAENPHLVAVFDELFSPEGYEIYLKPATEYVKPGKYAFGAICESAARRAEVAIGYRLAAAANDADAGYGVTINPNKRSTIQLADGDKVIVLAES